MTFPLRNFTILQTTNLFRAFRQSVDRGLGYRMKRSGGFKNVYPNLLYDLFSLRGLGCRAGR